jgi:Fe-S cluster assembly iron-binding protein IscA
LNLRLHVEKTACNSLGYGTASCEQVLTDDLGAHYKTEQEIILINYDLNEARRIPWKHSNDATVTFLYPTG